MNSSLSARELTQAGALHQYYLDLNHSRPSGTSKAGLRSASEATKDKQSSLHEPGQDASLGCFAEALPAMMPTADFTWLKDSRDTYINVDSHMRRISSERDETRGLGIYVRSNLLAAKPSTKTFAPQQVPSSPYEYFSTPFTCTNKRHVGCSLMLTFRR